MYIDKATRQKLKDKYKDEKVFVVPFDSVTHIPDKFSPNNEDIKLLNKYDTKGKYILRHDAEYNPAFQQLIPYVLITDATGEKYFVSKRIAGDTRLLGKLSLGFGGHINPCDGALAVILAALHRELSEEVEIDMVEDSIEFLGNVRDLTSTTPDHLGFAFTVKANQVRIKEDDVLEGLWMSKQELIENYFGFESWSRYIIDHFYESEENTEQ
ncbi:NUDIX domain-containing protein [Bacillus spizizenii]|nr:NUDIX domain-containing protein [Bacillus spizizenii]MCY8890462.1 NUDIX domain-containing protein [Bacillus spizizenii]MEC0841917.1 NUDIX domain-containing protein [Bacillus spizizenii]